MASKKSSSGPSQTYTGGYRPMATDKKGYSPSGPANPPVNPPQGGTGVTPTAPTQGKGTK